MDRFVARLSGRSFAAAHLSVSLKAWCVAGNCFSLQREHDIAIKFFQRAIQVILRSDYYLLLSKLVMDTLVGWLNGPFLPQVDPGFAYAYTLLGHEFVLTEELDRALACFRNAIRVNSRHYNAWYVTMVTRGILHCIKCFTYKCIKVREVE